MKENSEGITVLVVKFVRTAITKCRSGPPCLVGEKMCKKMSKILIPCFSCWNFC